MSNFRVFLKLWLPVLLWMSVIFCASADSHSYEHSSMIIEPILRWLFPTMSQENIGHIHEGVRKCGHLTEYCVLALLLWRAVSQTKTGRLAWSPKKIGGVLLVVFAYAGSDEFHQRFVPTRTAHFTDVLIDTTGGALGLLALWIFQRRQRPAPQK